MKAADLPRKPQAEPAGAEWWLGYAALIAPAMLLLVGKGEQAEATDSSLPSQILWTVAYFLAGRSLLAHSDAFWPLVNRSRILWIFVLMMLASATWSVDPLVSFKDAIELIGTTVIACYFVVRYTLPRFLNLVGSAYGTIAVLSLITIVIAPGRGRDDWGSGPWCGVYQDKNNLGAAMAMTTLAITVLLLTPSGRRKLTKLATGLLGFVLLIGSSSATALSSLVVAMSVGMAALVCRSPRFGHIVTVIVLVSGALGVAWFSLGGFNPDAAAESLGRSSTLTGRTDFWPYLIQAIGDRPILGYGYKAFFRSSEGTDYLSYYVVEAGGWSPYHAHDTFLQTCLDVGYIGLGVLVLLMLIGLVRAVRFLATGSGPSAAWPLMVVLYIAMGSYTETYLANFNSFEWIFFVAALLYPVHLPARSSAVASAGLSSAMLAIASPPVVEDHALCHPAESFAVDGPVWEQRPHLSGSQ